MDSCLRDWWCQPVHTDTVAGCCWRSYRPMTVSMNCRCSPFQFCIWSGLMETARSSADWMCTDLLCKGSVVAAGASDAMVCWLRRRYAGFACWCRVCRDFSRRNDGIATTECTTSRDPETGHANQQWIEDARDRMIEHCEWEEDWD